MKVSFSMNNLCLFSDKKGSETMMRFQELEALFPYRLGWDENSWANFRGFNLNCEIAQPSPLSQRITELARETLSEDDMRIFLVPGGVSLDKLKLILKNRQLPLTIEVDPRIERFLGETENPAIYVAKTEITNDFVPEERFSVLVLVTLAVISYGSVQNKTILFENSTILCSDTFEEGYLSVTLTKDKITIALDDIKNPKVVEGTCVKAN